MSEYIPKYPSKEGDDSNKTSSELLAETLKPIYVPQDLMLAWESHLASYSRDTNVLLDQVKDSELALNTQYQALLARVQKYEQMLQDITMDSNEFTMDTDEVNFTGWNILAQASYWDYLLRKEITKLSDQIKSTEYKGGLVTEVTDAVLEGLIADNTYISNVIGALSDTPLIRELDAALTSTVTSITDLQAESVRLAEKQAADAAAFADQQEEMLGQLVTSIEASKAEQLNRLAEEAAIRTQLLQELEAKTDAITADYNTVVDTLHTTVIQELTSLQDGISASVSELKTADEAIITSLDAYKVSNGQNIAALQNSVNVVTNTQESIATQVTGLIASFDQIDLGLSKAQADIITSNQARADGDAALSQQITTINTGLGDANSRIDTVNTAVSTLDTATATKFSELATTLAGVDDSIASVRQIADTAVSNDTAQATEINALKSRMSITEGDVITKADATVLSTLETKVDSTDAALAIRIDSLVANLTAPDGTTVDANAFNLLRTKVNNNSGTLSTHTSQITSLESSLSNVNTGLTANADAVSDLTATVTQQGDSITSHAQSIQQLKADLDVAEAGLATKASTTALNTTNTNVSSLDGRVTATNSAQTLLEGRVQTIEGEVTKKADASALTSLSTRVDTEEGKSLSQGNAITALQNTINHATTGLASKASSSAVTAVDNKVTAANGRIDTTNSNVATLTGRVSTVEGAVSTKAEASALTALTTRVSNAEGVNTSQGSAITTLENTVNHATTGLNTKASSSALSTLDSKVTSIDGRVTSNTGSITNLQAGLTAANNSISTKADSSALNALTARVDSTENGIQATNTSVTSLESKLNNVSVGATNLLPDTKNVGNIGTYLGFGYKRSTRPGGSNQYVDPLGYFVNNLSAGTYVLSFYARANKVQYVNNFFYAPDNTQSAESSTGDKSNHNNGRVTTILTTEWKRYWVRWTIPSDTESKGLVVARLDGYDSSERWIEIAAPKLEKGTLATDWSPATSDTASAAALSTLDTKVTSIDGKVTTQASSITQLQADVSGNSSKLTVQGDVVNGLKASYVVKTDVNGLVAGYGLYNTGSTAAFGVNADYFYVGRGTTATGGKKPFMVTTTNQVVDGITYPAGTWINTAIIADATIGNAKIANLDAGKINVGTLSADRIASKSISADKLVVGSGANMYGDQYNLRGTQGWGGGVTSAYDVVVTGNALSLSDRDHIGPADLDIPIRVGETYVIEVVARRSRGNLSLNAGFWYYKADKQTTPSPYHYVGSLTSTVVHHDWAKYTYHITVSEGGGDIHNRPAYGRLYFQIDQPFSSGSTTWRVGDIKIMRAVENALVVNGGITADKLAVNSVTADKISADVFTTVAPDGAKSIIEGGTFKVYYPNGNLAVFIGVS